MTTNTHSVRHILGASSTLHTGQHTYKGDLVPQKLLANPVDTDACWEGPLDKGCGGLGPWFRKPRVYPPYSHERTTASSLSQSNLNAKGSADGNALTSPPTHRPSAGLCKESSLVSKAPESGFEVWADLCCSAHGGWDAGQNQAELSSRADVISIVL